MDTAHDVEGGPLPGVGLTVGVLALQGDVREHLTMLRALGAEAIPVRRPEELARVAGLVIPGGESSVIDKLSRAFGMAEPIVERIAAGMPAFGTCAGLIMLADRVTDAIEGQRTFGGLDVTVRRNAFGNQLDSFETALEIPVLGGASVRAVFIRAPLVEEIGEGATVLASLDDGRVVAVEQGGVLGTAFHPEVAGEPRLHARFLGKVRAATQSTAS